MQDLTFELISLRDENRVERDGSTMPEKVARFYLGKFGPFTERFNAADFTDDAFRLRRDALTRTLENLHR